MSILDNSYGSPDDVAALVFAEAAIESARTGQTVDVAS